MADCRDLPEARFSALVRMSARMAVISYSPPSPALAGSAGEEAVGRRPAARVPPLCRRDGCSGCNVTAPPPAGLLPLRLLLFARAPPSAGTLFEPRSGARFALAAALSCMEARIDAADGLPFPPPLATLGSDVARCAAFSCICARMAAASWPDDGIAAPLVLAVIRLEACRARQQR